MKRVAVIYWTMTGNTEAMANAIAEAAGTEATDWATFSAEEVSDYDALAFGCPAMGDEELDADFAELWDACAPKLGDRPVALFGSYDWGTGAWMETWEASASADGVNVIGTLIANLSPDDDALAACRDLGKRLAG